MGMQSLYHPNIRYSRGPILHKPMTASKNIETPPTPGSALANTFDAWGAGALNINNVAV